MANAPLTDISLGKLYKAITGLSPYPLPLSEREEKEQLHAGIIREIQSIAEGERLIKLAHAIDMYVPNTPQLSDSQLVRLLRAVS